MKQDAMFLWLCDQMAGLLRSQNEFEVLGLARILRQFLCDSPSLIDIVNVNKLRIRYCVVPFDPTALRDIMPDVVLHFSSIQSHGFARETKLVSKDVLRAHYVLMATGQTIKVIDLILYCANIAGAVHFHPNPTNDKDKALQNVEQLFIGGMSSPAAILKDLANVVLVGLKPLMLEVGNRIS